MKKCLVGIMALVLVLVLATGCSGGSTSIQPTATTTPPAGMGTLKVYVTDELGDIEKLWVNIERLEVHKAGGPWETIFDDDQGREFELIELGTEEIEEFLASEVVDSGWYTQLRLDILDNVRIKIEGDETDHYAKVPSGWIKLVGQFEVKENGVTEITLDFDVEKSVHEIGAKDKDYSYIFKPVIKLLVTEALELTTPSLPNGGVDTPYNATVEAVGGTPPYAWSISAGTFHPDLTLDPVTGAISGTPTTAGPYDFTVQVTDSSDPLQIDTQEFSIIIAGSGVLIITTTNLPDGEVGTPYDATVEAIGGTPPYAWSISAGTFHPDLTLDPVTGAISGTPTTAGDYIFTVEVEDSPSATDTQELSIHIED